MLMAAKKCTETDKQCSFLNKPVPNRTNSDK
ncbi:hypothetical protein BN8_06451 [Fibrisoma limi BUZ 3]|uniref:Uncharacterized protein n=1 Tax=Fibrisoma limi BUZ 3 TaxID=1185876 RepID=I2GT23_9BACT|nr:hypothetical protein BN8_06451 [Fibrisoma limi BUZ 3]